MDLVAFGANLRAIREQAGLTQEELAFRLGKTQKTLSKIETGAQRIFADDLLNFASVLQVPFSALLTGPIALDDFDALILAEIHRLPTLEARQAVLKLIRDFREYAETAAGQRNTTEQPPPG